MSLGGEGDEENPLGNQIKLEGLLGFSRSGRWMMIGT